LLARLEARGTLPKIFTINTSAEYWRGDASLVHTDIPGKRDVRPVRAARVYLFAGTQHTPGTGPPPDADPNTGGRGREPFNVVDYAPLLRAALVSLDRWVTDGVEPPASNVPRLADGTAVAAEVTVPVFTKIPGVRFPDRIDRPVRLDFGPELARGIVTELPPKVGAPFVTFVSAVDADGNEIAGVRPVELLAPLATFTGWNPRHPTQGAPGDLMSMMGSTLPLPRTRAERLATGDPRRAIEERYPSRAAYLERVRAAALALVAARHVLAEDLDAIVERAGRLWEWVQARVPSPRLPRARVRGALPVARGVPRASPRGGAGARGGATRPRRGPRRHRRARGAVVGLGPGTRDLVSRHSRARRSGGRSSAGSARNPSWGW